MLKFFDRWYCPFNLSQDCQDRRVCQVLREIQEDQAAMAHQANQASQGQRWVLTASDNIWLAEANVVSSSGSAGVKQWFH